MFRQKGHAQNGRAIWFRTPKEIRGFSEPISDRSYKEFRVLVTLLLSPGVDKNSSRPKCDDTFYTIRTEMTGEEGKIEFEPPDEQKLSEFHPKTSSFDLSILICDVFGLGISLSFILK